MKKTISVMMLLLFLILTACSSLYPQKSPMVRVEDVNCSAMGYVPVEEANQLINITNRLITVVNVCVKQSNSSMEALPYFGYFESKK